MGRGNVCVLGECEGLYYIDNDHLEMYSRYIPEDDAYETITQGEYFDLSQEEQEGWKYDSISSEDELHNTLFSIQEQLCERFKSFKPCDEWISRERHAFLENDLFYIATEDNEWSVAVELLQKQDQWYFSDNLQKRHFRKYLKALEDALLFLFTEIGTYKGAWTHGILRRGEN